MAPLLLDTYFYIYLLKYLYWQNDYVWIKRLIFADKIILYNIRFTYLNSYINFILFLIVNFLFYLNNVLHCSFVHNTEHSVEHV